MFRKTRISSDVALRPDLHNAGERERAAPLGTGKVKHMLVSGQRGIGKREAATAESATKTDRTSRKHQLSVNLNAAATGELVRMAAKGDDRAWAELINRFGPMVLRVARSTGLNASDAADACQATWIQLMRRADQVREPERIGGWLATTARRQSQRIAMTACSQMLSPDPIASVSPIATPIDEVDSVVLQDQYDPALERALDRLPTSYRKIMELLSLETTPTYQDVARAMGLPVGSIGPMRMRALQMLRRDPELQASALLRCVPGRETPMNTPAFSTFASPS
jgi:RNA polymerase sigma factor (sigma-70 family)